MGRMKTAFSYARWSSAKQAKGASFLRQTEAALTYCNTNGYTLDSSLRMVDAGISGFTGANRREGTALAGFLVAIDAGRIPVGSLLIVESLDRLSREDIDAAFTLFRNILSKGINILTLIDNQLFTKDSLKDIVKLMSSLIVMQRANEESETKSKRIKDAWNRRRANLSNKKIDAQWPHWLELSDDKKTFSVIPSSADAISYIFEQYAKGVGTVTINRHLNSTAVPTVSRRSKHWTTPYIQSLLRNRRLIGELQNYKMQNGDRVAEGDVIENYFPVVVEKHLFDKVQMRLGKNARDTSTKADGRKWDNNLFQGKLFCGYCGSAMRVGYVTCSKKMPDGTYKQYNKSRKLVCRNALDGLCLNISWDFDEFEQEFLSHSDEIRAALSPTIGAKAVIQDAINTVDASITTKRKAISRLEELLEADSDLPEGMLKKWKTLESDIKELQAERTKREQELNAASSKNPFSAIPPIKGTLTPEQRLRLADAIAIGVEKIQIFFAGSRFGYAKAFSEYKRLKASGKINNYLIRRLVDTEKVRFFSVRLEYAGKESRLQYPVVAADMSEVQSLDVEPLC